MLSETQKAQEQIRDRKPFEFFLQDSEGPEIKIKIILARMHEKNTFPRARRTIIA